MHLCRHRSSTQHRHARSQSIVLVDNIQPSISRDLAKEAAHIIRFQRVPICLVCEQLPIKAVHGIGGDGAQLKTTVTSGLHRTRISVSGFGQLL